MSVPLSAKHLWVSTVVILLLCVLDYQCHELDQEDFANRCSHETCVSILHLLEEQTIRLRKVEETLARTLTILTSNGQDFAATATTLRADLRILSSKSSKNSDSVGTSMLRLLIPNT